MEGKNADAAVDYISKLPEPILQKILSFLLVKEAAQLSTLSKTFNSAWNSLSYLNFGYILSKNITELVNVVDQILANRQNHKLELPHNGIKFSSLRVLDLSKALLGEHFIQALCESCSSLEDSTLNECRGLASLQIAGTLPKLRRVWLACL
ncbi:F-box/LRR-repeat protein At3g26922-like [Nicotiana tabacum]|uniref:F-box/LRR-repeat protein At3g26922-like n=1 Tax=Nicotiana tabacum TaxID=4097 RepID=A0AC58SJE5_TOBAC